MSSDASATLSLADFSADFSHGHGAAPVPLSSRVTAAALTAALYGLIIAMATVSAWTVPRRPPPDEVVAKLMVEPAKPVLPIPPIIPAHLVKPPPAQSPSPPSFAVADEAPPPQATLPSTAAIASPLKSGVPNEAGAGQGGTASGTAGVALSGCFDAIWAKAVSDRIGQFLFYPASEKRRHISGLVLVRIGVMGNGRLALLKVNQSSGVNALDRAALATVQAAQPLPRIPERMHLARADVELPILFGDPDKTLTPSPGNCAQ